MPARGTGACLIACYGVWGMPARVLGAMLPEFLKIRCFEMNLSALLKHRTCWLTIAMLIFV